MTSEEHANQVAEIVGRLSDRILGVGMLQYDDGSGFQRFEKRPLEAIVQDALEEIEDLVVYACQLHIRVRQIADSVPF
jgi:hypothetical protein